MQHPSDEQATNTADSGEPRDVCAVGDARSKASEDNGTGGGEKGGWVRNRAAVAAAVRRRRAWRPSTSTPAHLWFDET
jgi:hypothetical protein